jgi:hypothetical protein
LETEDVALFSLPELMDRLAKRPDMFVHPVTFATMQGYLTGLAAGLCYAGIEHTWEEYHAAAQSRGWNTRGNLGILRDFTAKGITEEAMVRELIAVKADAYARALARIEAHAAAGAV